MSLFSEILCKQFEEIDIDRMEFFMDDINTHKSFVEYGFLRDIQSNDLTGIRNKFNILYDTILINRFITPNRKERILNKFSKAQKYYHTLLRFQFMYKYKHAKEAPYDCDLLLNPLVDIKDELKYTIMEDDVKYQFRLTDLMQIIEKALSNSENFFLDSQYPRLPYTNVRITKANLYNIYFKVRNSSFIMPVLFHQFFLCDFNLKRFICNSECLARDINLKEHIRNCNCDDLRDLFEDMLDDYQKHTRNRLRPHKQFPNKILIDIFAPYLELYLYSILSLNPAKKYESQHRLRIKLRLFTQINPGFGRMIKKRYANKLLYNFEQKMEKNNIYNFSDKKSQTSYIKHETYPDLYFVGPQFLGNNFENKIADILSVTGLDHIDEQSYRTLAISHPYYIQTTRQLTMNIDIEDTYSDEYNEGLPNPLLNIGTSENPINLTDDDATDGSNTEDIEIDSSYEGNSGVIIGDNEDYYNYNATYHSNTEDPDEELDEDID